jgi:hypothetical protein
LRGAPLVDLLPGAFLAALFAVFFFFAIVMAPVGRAPVIPWRNLPLGRPARGRRMLSAGPYRQRIEFA